ncbi:MAG: hypothetical protein ACYCUM_08420 [Solirubrobacteraceae bacterium]
MADASLTSAAGGSTIRVEDSSHSRAVRALPGTATDALAQRPRRIQSSSSAHVAEALKPASAKEWWSASTHGGSYANARASAHATQPRATITAIAIATIASGESRELELAAVVAGALLEAPPAAGAVPVAGVPAPVVPVAGVPASVVAVAGVPVAGVPVAGVPVAGALVAGVPVDGVPVAGVPVAGAPVAGVPVDGAPPAVVPVCGVPVARVPTAVEPATPAALAIGTSSDTAHAQSTARARVGSLIAPDLRWRAAFTALRTASQARRCPT